MLIDAKGDIYLFPMSLRYCLCKKMQNVHIYFKTNRFNIFGIFTTERGIQMNLNNSKERYFTTNKCKKKKSRKNYFILTDSVYVNFTGLMVPAVVCSALGLLLIVSVMCYLFSHKR